MTVKTTGAEFKRFYFDDAYWPDGVYHDDTVLEVDGAELDNMADYGTIPDASIVKIVSGVVIGSTLVSGDDAIGFDSYFKKWRKAQNTVSLVVECDKNKLDAVKAAIRAAGGRTA